LKGLQVEFKFLISGLDGSAAGVDIADFFYEGSNSSLNTDQTLFFIVGFCCKGSDLGDNLSSLSFEIGKLLFEGGNFKIELISSDD
jgi:hypothetical protein